MGRGPPPLIRRRSTGGMPTFGDARIWMGAPQGLYDLCRGKGPPCGRP